jgi:hypothetical protein
MTTILGDLSTNFVAWSDGGALVSMCRSDTLRNPVGSDGRERRRSGGGSAAGVRECRRGMTTILGELSPNFVAGSDGGVQAGECGGCLSVCVCVRVVAARLGDGDGDDGGRRSARVGGRAVVRSCGRCERGPCPRRARRVSGGCGWAREGG